MSRRLAPMVTAMARLHDPGPRYGRFRDRLRFEGAARLGIETVMLCGAWMISRLTCGRNPGGRSVQMTDGITTSMRVASVTGTSPSSQRGTSGRLMNCTSSNLSVCGTTETSTVRAGSRVTRLGTHARSAKHRRARSVTSACVTTAKNERHGRPAPAAFSRSDCTFWKMASATLAADNRPGRHRKPIEEFLELLVIIETRWLIRPSMVRCRRTNSTEGQGHESKVVVFDAPHRDL